MKVCGSCQISFTASSWECPSCGFTPPKIDDFVALAPDLANGGGGFRPEAFKKLAALEATNFWFRARNQLILWSLKKYFVSISRYMEIGCGTGYVLTGVANAYPAAKLVGSEIFCAGLPFAAARLNTAELIQMNARQIPFTDEFDVIGAFDVLEHIEQDEIVMAAILRALKPGGGAAITVPQHPWLWSSEDDSACHVRRYRVDELRNKMTRAGFKVEFETSFVSLLLPAMLISRLAKRKPKNNESALSELSLPKWLNYLFERVMNLERQMIKHGISFNLGGSRLLIATKRK